MKYNPDFTARITAPSHNAYSADEVSSIITSTTGTTVSDRDVVDKPLDDLMLFVFSDILDQEDSYDY